MGKTRSGWALGLAAALWLGSWSTPAPALLYGQAKITPTPTPTPAQAKAAPTPNRAYRQLARAIGRNKRVALTPLYDGNNGNFTALSQSLADRIEARLKAQALQLVARQENALVEEDLDQYGNSAPRRKAGSPGPARSSLAAEVLITGKYYIQPATNPRQPDRVALHLKAIRARDRSILASQNFHENLPPRWRRLATKIWYNVYNSAMKTIANKNTGQPMLRAQLDREDPCYPAGAEAVVSVESEKGVYLYIFSLAADNTVTILYPNRLLPGKKLRTKKLQFPPPILRQKDRLHLLLYPLNNKDTSETIKVVASRQALNFSFLPQPVNAVFSGAKGGNIKKMLRVLQQARNWTSRELGYWVGPRCNNK